VLNATKLCQLRFGVNPQTRLSVSRGAVKVSFDDKIILITENAAKPIRELFGVFSGKLLRELLQGRSSGPGGFEFRELKIRRQVTTRAQKKSRPKEFFGSALIARLLGNNLRGLLFPDFFMLLILHLPKKHRQRPIPKSFNLHFYNRLVVKINQRCLRPQFLAYN
jgi:hypothetical protein